jgi:hypothetical protein
MGFIKAMKTRRAKNDAKKTALKEAIKQSRRPVKDDEPNSPQSVASTVAPSPDAPLKSSGSDVRIPLRDPSVDPSVDFLDAEMHECNGSIQLSLHFQDSLSVRTKDSLSVRKKSTPSDSKEGNEKSVVEVDDIIDTFNIEATLSEIKSQDEEEDSLGDSQQDTLSFSELATVKSYSSDKSLNYLWRYMTCNLGPSSTFDLMHDDESIFTLESEDGSTVATVPKKELKSIQEAEEGGDKKGGSSETDDATPTQKNLTASGAQENQGNTLIPRKLFHV